MIQNLCVHSGHLFNPRPCRGFYEDFEDTNGRIFELDRHRPRFISRGRTQIHTGDRGAFDSRRRCGSKKEASAAPAAHECDSAMATPA